MRPLAALLLTALLLSSLFGCANAPPMPPAADLFHDESFAPASVPVGPEQAMALSASMR